jgi:hypothetical protein
MRLNVAVHGETNFLHGIWPRSSVSIRERILGSHSMESMMYIRIIQDTVVRRQILNVPTETRKEKPFLMYDYQ